MFPKIADSKKKFCFEYAHLNFGNLLSSESSKNEETLFRIACNWEEVILYFSNP